MRREQKNHLRSPGYSAWETQAGARRIVWEKREEEGDSDRLVPLINSLFVCLHNHPLVSCVDWWLTSAPFSELELVCQARYVKHTCEILHVDCGKWWSQKLHLWQREREFVIYLRQKMIVIVLELDLYILYISYLIFRTLAAGTHWVNILQFVSWAHAQLSSMNGGHKTDGNNWIHTLTSGRARISGPLVSKGKSSSSQMLTLVSAGHFPPDQV